MCGRTSLFVPQSVLEERFEASVAFDYAPRYNVAPREPLAVVRNTDTAHVVQQEWGLLPHWADDADAEPRPINARAETVAEKPMFRDALAERRCLVLADGFYEWQGERGSKQPYRVHLADDAPFAMAGLWNRFEGGEDPLETVTILTTDPNEVMAHIHDRMPVVLTPEAEATWLSGDVDAALSVCGPYGGEDMAAYPVSTAVNDPTTDDPSVVERASEEQSGLGDFGA